MAIALAIILLAIIGYGIGKSLGGDVYCDDEPFEWHTYAGMCTPTRENITSDPILRARASDTPRPTPKRGFDRVFIVDETNGLLSDNDIFAQVAEVLREMEK